MSNSDANIASEKALKDFQSVARENYGIALPGLKTRQDALNASINLGESPLMKDAFEAERSQITNAAANNATTLRQTQLAQNKGALSGGNVNASLSPADIGSQLANALYGNKFKEGSADIEQKMNYLSMALGGAGQSGNGALAAAGHEMGAIGFLPRYNSTYANAVGLGAGLASGVGAVNQAWPQLLGKPGTTNTGAVLPPSTVYSSFVP
jgi:hypothetical protein